MLYFLINNDFHLSFDRKFIQKINNGINISLIQVPYSLSVVEEDSLFKEIYCFPQIHLSFSRIFKIFRIKKLIRRSLKIKTDDILYVHSERDLTNQFIIQLFYTANAKIFLLEDGVSTMCMFNMDPGKISFKEQIKYLLLKQIFGFHLLNVGRYGIENLYTMSDEIFKGLIITIGHKINRNIKIYKVTLGDENVNNIDINGAIFLNQDYYRFISNVDEYISFVIENLIISKNFNPFYFKFHPSDSDYFKQELAIRIKDNYENIIIIYEESNFENLITTYPVANVISFNSSACFNLINSKFNPIFLNHFLEKKYPNILFKTFEIFLNSINCKYPTNLYEVTPKFISYTSLSHDTTYLEINEIS